MREKGGGRGREGERKTRGAGTKGRNEQQTRLSSSAADLRATTARFGQPQLSGGNGRNITRHPTAVTIAINTTTIDMHHHYHC